MLKTRRKAANHRITVGDDKAYDTADHVAALRALDVTAHVACNDAPVQPFALLGTQFDNISLHARLFRGHGASPALPEIAIQRSSAEINDA